MQSVAPCHDSLVEAKNLYLEHLDGKNLFSFDLRDLDRTGFSIKVASLRDEQGFTNDGFGYGTSELESEVGALGEISETYHLHYSLQNAPSCLGLSYLEMTDLFGTDRVINPEHLCLPAGSFYTKQIPLKWVEVKSYPSMSPHWIPREFIAASVSDYESPTLNILHETGNLSKRIITPITCGLGAGITLEQALLHAIYELLQRDGNCTNFRAMDQGIDIELDEIIDAEVLSIFNELANIGINLRPKLASTDFGLCNLYVTAEDHYIRGKNDHFPLVVTSCGEAVDANREKALRKASTEYLASRCRKTFMHGPLEAIAKIAPQEYFDRVVDHQDPACEEERALNAMTDWLGKTPSELLELLEQSVLSSKSKVKFSSLPYESHSSSLSHPVRLDSLSKKLIDEKLSIFYFDASPEGTSGPRAVKAVVTKLEGETMSYYRIGERGYQRLENRDLGLVGRGKRLHSRCLPILIDEEAKARLGDDLWLDANRIDSTIHDLYALYREPSSHTAQLALKNKT